MASVRGALIGLLIGAVYSAIPVIAAGLVPGGSWIWPRGWWFVGVASVVIAMGSGYLAHANPAAFRVRMQGVVARSERRQPLTDRLVSLGLALVWFAWLVFIPWDVFDLRLLPPPGPVWTGLGIALALIGIAIMYTAIAQNEFAAPNVQDQSDTGQRVIDTGLYALVRHPLYAGAVLLLPGVSLCLGSSAGVIVAFAGFLPLLAIRIAVEESFLRKSLPGYVDYCRRVRARLIPFVV